mmetsp:Transcript_62030/g.146893  ORF Transcript_62030/g.146893 Transcript_62030/m.146893 type:complete len:351 (-) Transcript_62030:691-1743(-)
MVHHPRDVVLHHPHQRLVVVGVDGLHVGHEDRQLQHVLVHGPREMRVQQVPVVHRLAHDAADEMEVAEVVRTEDVGAGVGLIGEVGADRVGEETDVGVEHLTRKAEEPLTRNTPSVNAFLALEGDGEPSPHLLGSTWSDLVEAVLQQRISTHRDTDGVVSPPLTPAPYLAAEVGPLVVEVEELREADEGGERRGEERRHLPTERVEDVSVSLGKVDEGTDHHRLVDRDTLSLCSFCRLRLVRLRTRDTSRRTRRSRDELQLSFAEVLEGTGGSGPVGHEERLHEWQQPRHGRRNRGAPTSLGLDTAEGRHEAAQYLPQRRQPHPGQLVSSRRFSSLGLGLVLRFFGRDSL